jgi:hypothetical protein
MAPTRIDVAAAPIASFDLNDPARTRFGALEFRGGLGLTSSEHAFGGISGLRVDADGSHFPTVSDIGSWLRGRYSGRADAEMAPLLGADGHPLAARGWFDAESLENDNGTLYVGLERVEQIARFDGQPLSVPADFTTFKFNKSPECLAMSPKGSPLAGTLIVVTVRSLDADGNHRSYLLNGGEAERFSVKRSDDLDVSDCTMLRPADLLLLERRYSPARGRRHTHPPHPARKRESRRVGGQHAADLRRPRLPDRQHGGHRRAQERRRRDHRHADFGRQFFGTAAQSAFAVRAGRGAGLGGRRLPLYDLPLELEHLRR